MWNFIRRNSRAAQQLVGDIAAHRRHHGGRLRPAAAAPF
jgi:hypothetical protein